MRYHKNKHKGEKFALLYVLIVLLISFLFLIVFVHDDVIKVVRKFNAPLIKAKNAIVYDTTFNKVLYEKKADDVVKLASLVKVMTAVVAEEELAKDKSVYIAGNAVVVPDYLQNSYGEEWARDELVRFMLFVSSNTAANALNFEAINQNKSFIFKMNKKAQDLKLDTLSFSNPSGLDDLGDPGSYGSARDFAKLFEYAISNYPYVFEPTKYKEYNFISSTGHNYVATNTNEIADKVPGLYASKTGFTNAAGGNLTVAFEVSGRKVIIVVLGSDKEARFIDMKALVDETINILEK